MVTRYVIVCSDGVVRTVQSCDDGCRELALFDTEETAKVDADAYTAGLMKHRIEYPAVAAAWETEGVYCCHGPHTVAVATFDANGVE